MGALLSLHENRIIDCLDRSHGFNNELQRALTASQKQNAVLQAKFDEIIKKIDCRIESYEDLKRFDDEAADAVVKLSVRTKAAKLSGRNFGFFGTTSTGKSTIINKLLAKDVAAVGEGETTLKITGYPGQGYTLYDMPGRNDELSYFSLEYVSFWKGLTARIIVIQATVKEMSKVLRVFEKINLNYDIIFNKFDTVNGQERDNFKLKIKKEITDLGLNRVNRIWFVSAKNPDQFPDWLDMVNYLTN